MSIFPSDVVRLIIGFSDIDDWDSIQRFFGIQSNSTTKRQKLIGKLLTVVDKRRY
jgi:hypothetical protein